MLAYGNAFFDKISVLPPPAVAAPPGEPADEAPSVDPPSPEEPEESDVEGADVE